MRSAAAEKLEIIRLLEQSSLPVRRTLPSWEFPARPFTAGISGIGRAAR
jgi:hypothetical protein